MRIISGTHKGRFFYPPANLPVRPTTDFGKEALFNILNNRIDFLGAKALDLFAGTGNLTYELASRGCAKVLAIDQHAACIQYIKKNIQEWGFANANALKADVNKFIHQTNEKFDLILADPPYSSKEIGDLPQRILQANLLLPSGWLIVEHPIEVNFEAIPGFIEHRKYSKVNFSIFQQETTAQHTADGQQ